MTIAHADLLIRDVRLSDDRRVDVGIVRGKIEAIRPAGSLRPAADEVLEGGGRRLIVGLHDHHIHLAAAAAADRSVDCGPPHVSDAAQLEEVLRRAAHDAGDEGWVRGVGYHESVAGDLDRSILDAMVERVPVRLQHRSGAAWFLNSAALGRVVGSEEPPPAGVAVDAAGRPTGVLWRADDLLRSRAPSREPNLAALGKRLAERGVTGVTDATPDLDEAGLRLLLNAVASGAVPQRLHLLGVDRLPDDLDPRLADRVTVGPRKVLLADHDLPSFSELAAKVRAVRATRGDDRRPVAVHCVTAASLALLCAVLVDVGTVPGDRIEHASVVPDEFLPALRDLKVTVVTQPTLVAERGDDYLRDVDPRDMSGLYRHASLLRAQIPVGLSTDAPYTAPDPWAAVDAAVTRRTRTGRRLGHDEAVTFEVAVSGFSTRASDPGGLPRRVEVGQVADLCLLEHRQPTASSAVAGTIAAGCSI